MKSIITAILVVITASTAFADRYSTNYDNTPYYDAPHTWGPRSIEPLKATPNLISGQLYKGFTDDAWRMAKILIEAGYNEGVLDGERGASKEDKPRRHVDVSKLLNASNIVVEDTTNKWDHKLGYNPVYPINVAIYSGANRKDIINVLQHNLDVIYHIGFVRGYEYTWAQYNEADAKASAMVSNAIKQMLQNGHGNVFMKPFMN